MTVVSIYKAFNRGSRVQHRTATRWNLHQQELMPMEGEIVHADHAGDQYVVRWFATHNAAEFVEGGNRRSMLQLVPQS